MTRRPKPPSQRKHAPGKHAPKAPRQPIATRAIFIQIDAPNRMTNVHWQASLYLDNGSELPFPVAVAWLSDYSDSPMEDMRFVVLDFILVPDLHRRQGYGTALVEACERRWPNLMLTDPISRAGEGFSDSLGDRMKPKHLG